MTDFITALEDLELIDPVKPAAPDSADQVAFECWKSKFKKHHEKIQEYSNFLSGLYNLVFSQCTHRMREHLKSHQNFQAVNQDAIRLLIIIKSLVHTFIEWRKVSDALNELKRNFFKLYQGKNT